jgi:hypothetical protein
MARSRCEHALDFCLCALRFVCYGCGIGRGLLDSQEPHVLDTEKIK